MTQKIQASGQRAALLALGLAALAIAAAVLLTQMYVVKTSSIDNVDELRYELMHLGRNIGSADWIDAWFWHEQQSPFKYRLLGKLSIWPLYRAISFVGVEPQRALYDAYLSCSLLFMTTSLFMLGVLMRELLARMYPAQPAWIRIILVGSALALFALSAPILFFVKFPIHGTPNDLIGYTLMLVALYCLSQRHLVGFVAVSVTAVFCRETTLLVPFIFLLFYPYPISKKLIAALLPVTVFVLYRGVWPGAYDALRGGQENLRVPLESAGFTLLTFGPLWLLGVRGYADLRKYTLASGDPFVQMLTNSFPMAVLLTLSIASMLASLWEMRIVFMLFFYFIPFSVIAVYHRRAGIIQLLGNKFFLFFTLAAVIGVFRFWLWMHPVDPAAIAQRANQFDFIFYGYVNSPQHNWIDILCWVLFLFLASLPVLSVSMTPPERGG